MHTTITHRGRNYRATSVTPPLPGGVFGFDSYQEPKWRVAGLAGQFETLDAAHAAVVVDVEAREAVERLTESLNN